MNEFPERLRKIMRVKGATQEDVSAATGITQASISGYVCGRKEPRVGNLIQIADYLDVSTDYLLGRSNKFPDWYEEKAQEALESIKDILDRDSVLSWIGRIEREREATR